MRVKTGAWAVGSGLATSVEAAALDRCGSGPIGLGGATCASSSGLGDLSEDGVDWERVGIDDIVARLEATFAEFMDEIGNVQQLV